MLAAGAAVQDARLLLAGLLFRGDDVFKNREPNDGKRAGRPSQSLYPGANLLVLDEPTNHMDIGPGKRWRKCWTSLKEALYLYP